MFLGHDNKVKLGDLGVSRILDKEDDMAMSRVGTPLYLAPELIKRQVGATASLNKHKHPYTDACKSKDRALASVTFQASIYG